MVEKLVPVSVQETVGFCGTVMYLWYNLHYTSVLLCRIPERRRGPCVLGGSSTRTFRRQTRRRDTTLNQKCKITTGKVSKLPVNDVSEFYRSTVRDTIQDPCLYFFYIGDGRPLQQRLTSFFTIAPMSSSGTFDPGLLSSPKRDRLLKTFQILW